MNPMVQIALGIWIVVGLLLCFVLGMWIGGAR